jgi:phage terminase large subunit
MTTTRIKLPQKLIPVFQGEADIRGAYGGRGSAKTRSFAKMVAVKGYQYGKHGTRGQLLCARQFMNSLDESSLEECKRAIQDEKFLSDYYDIGDKYIKSKDGRIAFTFAGLDRNIASIKSKGRILLCWVDEAEPVTDEAFGILIPTLREEGVGWSAELWVTWNPKRKTAAVERRFRRSKDARIKIVQLNWRDNPKFPAILERARQRDLEDNQDEYDHIWEGAYGSVKGSILGSLVARARAEGRINNSVVYDPDGAPIEVSSDIGFRDTASWWYWQRCLGGFRLLMYQGASGWDADDWIPEIEKNIQMLGAKSVGKIWLPHDAKSKTFQTKHSSVEKFLKAYGTGRVDVVPQSKKKDQIEAAKTIIKRVEFNEELCSEGIDGLEEWQFEWDEDLQVFSRDPLHNWASHPSDAFAYGCQVMQDVKYEVTTEPVFPVIAKSDNTIQLPPLDDMWVQASKHQNRRI